MEWLDETPCPRLSHPGMFWQLLLEYFKLAECSVLMCYFFLFYRKESDHSVASQFPYKTMGWPRMVNSAL
jgi:hypothetical protein